MSEGEPTATDKPKVVKKRKASAASPAPVAAGKPTRKVAPKVAVKTEAKPAIKVTTQRTPKQKPVATKTPSSALMPKKPKSSPKTRVAKTQLSDVAASVPEPLTALETADPETSPAPLIPSLQMAIAAELSGSVLPGDSVDEITSSPDNWLDEAARFVLATAQHRKKGTPAIDLASASEERRLLRIAIVNDDMPFLVDSVAAAISAAGLVIDRLVHPVITAVRDVAGKLIALPDTAVKGAVRESIIYIETARVDARQRRELLNTLNATLADVRAAVTDWPRMVAAMRADADRIDDAEGAALLRWFADGCLTQIAHVTRERSGMRSERLGLCRISDEELLSDASYARAFAAFDAQLEAGGVVLAPLAVKANRISTVHRRVPMDLFLIPIIEGAAGKEKVTALSVHGGMWTSAALAAAPDRVPRLRGQLALFSKRFDLDPAGHTGKALSHALTSLPHDLVVGLSEADVERLAMTMTGLVDRPRPRLLIARSPLMRHIFAFVWLPRDMLSTQMQSRIQGMIETAANAQTLDWSLQVEAGNLAMLRYTLDIREGNHEPNEAELDHNLQVMLRGWTEAVEAALAPTLEAGRAAAVAGRYADAFPMGYRTQFGPAEAALDITHLRSLVVGDTVEGSRDVRFLTREDDAPGQLRLKIYQAQGSLSLSDAVPALENFGFRVLGEMATLLDKGRLGTIHDFLLELGGQSGSGAISNSHATKAEKPAGEVIALAPMIEDALRAVLNGSGENDAFNGLVPALGLSSGEVNWLRAWYRYIRQAGTHFGVTTVVEALQNAPDVARGIIDLFRAIHDPGFSKDRGRARQKAENTIRIGLSHVTAINDDRVLRSLRDIVLAMLRTNAFAPAGEVALAFKFDSALVPGLPKPVPWREIFVYSPRVEGIHLRAGPIARGGLRWSDRRDDFRTEVLGLMKAQRVKNAVIVPTGAKGGFYPKQLPDASRDRAGWAAEGRASYEVFIDTLLSITDNIVADKVVHPASVVVLDGDDPYFVVAADKGTAKFSDVANGIAEARDFWLDDAFASGGSNGYDHKAMGITARGAWLSVQRHFLQLGVDVQTQPVRVVGCGDMSGDVFGNGMLLSQSLQVIGAFDHRHIFLDPNPDAASTWAERKRLFDLPVSSWDDFDKALISKGGGVFSRSMKSIPLTDEIRTVLGIDAKEIDPDSLITAILCAPVDLLWFGGIGTYVKSATENNVQVGDPTNDVLRVNGGEVRARVIGEGANLGVTQAGRIEFALRGGSINADFIDNSAGVDCSDNEVNIKIALAAAKRAGKLTEKKRVALLHAMTDEVAALVLEDNRLQALALSIAERGVAQALPAQIRVIETLQENGALDPRTEGLADSDTLLRRVQDGRGLTRPELAVLLSSGKLVLQTAIENSELPNDDSLSELLLAAFPTPMQKKYGRFIKGHRLAKEIIATKLANRIVNRLGVVTPFELAEEEGANLAQIAAAFTLADQLFGLSALWRRLETAPMTEIARVALFDITANAVRGHMADLLRAGAGRIAPSELYERLQKGVASLATDTVDLLGERTLAHSRKLRSGLTDLGASEDIAVQVGHLFDLDGAVGIAALGHETGIAPRRLVAAFTRIGGGLGLDWAQASAAMMNPSDPWERLLVAGLARDFQQMRLDFLRGIARTKSGRSDPVAATEAWGRDHKDAIKAFRSIVSRAENTMVITPAMLAQIASQARNLLGR